ncbi:carboxypeptidase Taq M32 metallopeptidase [Leptospira fainei serovar Hurstbridge str. BUT 6]|uniref:Metal-dependent carboxypeptidase n=1 Tax=Leptospira fainei serovar Hurstbridge str. BUT 6 TaxID=1193011 RepID=S3UV73_9LEPT|nr:carboxypeptidase Taq M32 metallopeptidase [Leptospira fainei serovar Hurstbridge str. BUT 6]
MKNWEKDLPAFWKYRKEFERISHLRNILSVLHWDMEVTLPEAGQEERAEQIGLLSGIAHEAFTIDTFKVSAEKAFEENNKQNLPGKELRSRELELLFRDLKRASSVPGSWVEKFAKLTSQAHSIWADARKKNDSTAFIKILQELLDLTLQKTDYLGYETEAYDSLLEDYEAGATAESLESLFESLRKSLVPLVKKSKDASSPFTGKFPGSSQKSFNERLPELLGLPKNISRLDASTHPFSTSLGSFDKRITTRYDEDDPLSSVYSVLHETGHALYETGISSIQGAYSPLKDSASLGLHESQSRLWENQVGRSKEFWEAVYPEFIGGLNISEKDLPFAKLFKFVNRAKPSLIRVEADQITYNLHIILRFRLERALLRRELKLKDLSGAWNAGMKELLGIEVPNDSQGYLQDVHWSGGAFGYFPTYTLGNIYAAQLYSGFLSKHPDFLSELRAGNTTTLLRWLRENVHLKGRKFQADEIVVQATGESPNAKYLVDYLSSKISEQE